MESWTRKGTATTTRYKEEMKNENKFGSTNLVADQNV